MENNEQKPAICFQGFTDAWEQRKLDDVIDKLTGGASIAPEDYVNEGVRTIPKGAVNDTGIADMSGCKIVSDEFFKKNISSKTSTGELVTSLRDLVPTAPNMGRIVRIIGDSEDFLMPQGVYSIILKENYDEDFLIAYSNSPEYRTIITKEKNGSTQVHIRNGEFLNIHIPIPSYDEQKKIGEFTKYLDNLITLHQRKYEKLVNVKKSMLEKMFPRDGAKVPEIRFAGFTDAWEQRKVSDIAEVVGGGTPSTSNSEYWDGDINWYAPAEIGEQIYVDSSERKITKLGLEKSSAKILPAYKTVLFTSRAGIGNTAILRTPAATNQGFQSMVLHDDINPYFVFSMTDMIKAKAERVASGSTFAEISGKMLGNLEFMFPSKNEQDKIGGYFESLDNLITLHQRKLEKLKNIKKSMLEKMFV